MHRRPLVLRPRIPRSPAWVLLVASVSGALLGGCGSGPANEPSAARESAAAAAAGPGAAAADGSGLAVPTDTRGELTLEFKWTSRLVSDREFKDVTVLDRRTTITCPITAADEATISALAGATPEQAEANARLAEAAAAEVAAVEPRTVAKAEAIEQKLKACRKAGGSEGECGMQAMADLQADPDLMESMAGAGQANPSARAAADAAVDAAAGRFQPWFNEGCRGSMTVADQRQLDDPTIPGPEPVVHTTGKQAIDTRETLVTVETDLAKGSTRYMIVAPQAEGFRQEAGYGEDEKLVSATAMPAAVVVAGPFAGGVQAGRHSFPVEGGEVRIEWTYRRP